MEIGSKGALEVFLEVIGEIDVVKVGKGTLLEKTKRYSKYHLDLCRKRKTHSDCSANGVWEDTIGYQISEATGHNIGKNFVDFDHDDGNEVRNLLASGDEFVKDGLKGSIEKGDKKIRMKETHQLVAEVSSVGQKLKLVAHITTIVIHSCQTLPQVLHSRSEVDTKVIG